MGACSLVWLGVARNGSREWSIFAPKGGGGLCAPDCLAAGACLCACVMRIHAWDCCLPSTATKHKEVWRRGVHTAMHQRVFQLHLHLVCRLLPGSPEKLTVPFSSLHARNLVQQQHAVQSPGRPQRAHGCFSCTCLPRAVPPALTLPALPPHLLTCAGLPMQRVERAWVTVLGVRCALKAAAASGVSSLLPAWAPLLPVALLAPAIDIAYCALFPLFVEQVRPCLCGAGEAMLV